MPIVTDREIRVQDLHREFKRGAGRVHALRGVSVTFTPRQVRRLIRLQVAGLILLVSPPAWLTGAVAARVFLSALVDRGLAPQGATVPGNPLPLVVATLATLLVGLLASVFATWRISHGTPSAAMTETSAETSRVGWFRVLPGLLIVGGVGVLCTFLVDRELDEAAVSDTDVWLLGIAVAAPVSIAFALSLSDDPVPYVPVGSYAPIIVGAVALAVTTEMAAGLRTVSLDPATTVTAP